MGIKVTIITDGACSGNPGPGGFAAIVRCGHRELEVMGYNPNTTNNRMELTAVVAAMSILKKPCDITIKTDSQYVCTGIALKGEWQQRGWKTKTGASCANKDLWQILTKLEDERGHHIVYEKVAGHVGIEDNERCDQMAKAQILKNKEN